MLHRALTINSLRYAAAHPLQTSLLIFGIALGVAVVVAIDMANSSVSRAFQLSTQSLTGHATHQIIGNHGDIDQEIYTDVRVNMGFRRCAPVITSHARVTEFGDRTLRLLGVDPFAETGFRNYLAGPRSAGPSEHVLSLLFQPGYVLAGENLARQYGIDSGDRLTLNFGEKSVLVRVAGLLEGDSRFAEKALSGMLIMDIAAAQEILELEDRISHIDLIIEPSVHPGEENLLKEIEQRLPTGVTIASTRKRSADIRQMSAAFESNLVAFSLLAIVVGGFLIYNTITFSVIRRRFLIGTLRALGVTRRDLFVMVVAETMILGLVGTGFGLVLGVILGTGAVRMVSHTVSHMYYQLTVEGFGVSMVTLFKGVLIGALASGLSALFPAAEAIRVAPAQALRRAILESRLRRLIPWLTGAGTAVMAIGFGLLFIPSRGLATGFSGIFTLILGAALLVPFFSRGMIHLLSRWIEPAGITGKMAVRNIPRSLSRTSVSIASLMVAVAVFIGVGIMVDSLRLSVLDWLDRSMTADIYVGAANEANPRIPPRVRERLEKMPEIRGTRFFQGVRINSGDFNRTVIHAPQEDSSRRNWIWTVGGEKEARRKFGEGWVFISETLSWKREITGQSGATVTLPTDRGERTFPVAGIFSDFSTQQGIVIMANREFRKHWDTTEILGIELYLKSGADHSQLASAIKTRLGPDAGVVVIPKAHIRELALEVFDRTFAITIALRFLAALVAFIGIVNTLTSLMLERTREIGILRANGMTLGQLWKMILTECGVIGGVAGILAFPLGSLLAWILIHVINKRSFGWTADLEFGLYHYILALVLSIAASLIAGLYPAYNSGRQPIAAALRME